MPLGLMTKRFVIGRALSPPRSPAQDKLRVHVTPWVSCYQVTWPHRLTRTVIIAACHLESAKSRSRVSPTKFYDQPTANQQLSHKHRPQTNIPASREYTHPRTTLHCTTIHYTPIPHLQLQLQLHSPLQPCQNSPTHPPARCSSRSASSTRSSPCSPPSPPPPSTSISAACASSSFAPSARTRISATSRVFLSSTNCSTRC
ncbi:hypothetical protein BU26DRAFT_160119 [Trematosphaeria pertusa]|uniref:Uncharacterized protein n=1 Tax=Trematosphaeria pertusa TaxID=390896 RepID=A0A6A6HW26_9PLEO|nr:uncharacterized protein BU26DRAFT_160119 [Trematosphaeria pertusa]KAF2242385.1 hypothetical protein BU26DRAFT_160119 [Trematosphaeria pertusa]